MGPLIELVEEVSATQVLAARMASFIAPQFEAVSFSLVRVNSKWLLKINCLIKEILFCRYKFLDD